LGDEYFEVDNLVSYCVVPTGGKGRGVTVASSDMGLLGPLHSTCYDVMSEMPWLLRGEAKPGRFRRFQRREGEVFVSGDYESASDNLRVEVADTIIDVLQSRSRKVPSTVWNACRAFLRCRVKYPDIDRPLVSEGQMMGNLMCFPLLCLQNYVAFRWVFDDTVPVKINGDDIVFRAPRSDFDRWADFVGRVGLVLSRGKTLVDERFFSLNSAFFWSRPTRAPRPVPVTRVACFSKQFEDWGSLGGSFLSMCRGYSGEARVLAEVCFLKRFRKRILQAGRSVRRGLCVPASTVALQRSGLWRRECWYFESVPESSDSLPDSPCRLKWGAIPDGWRRVPEHSVRLHKEVVFHRSGEKPPPAPSRPLEVEALQRSFWSALAARTWEEAPLRGNLLDEYWRSVLATSREGLYTDWRKSRTRWRFGSRVTARPMPCSDQFKVLCRVTRNAADKWTPRKRGRLVWCPFEEPETEEEVWPFSVSDLAEYEKLSFEPPAYYDAFDERFGLGYR